MLTCCSISSLRAKGGLFAAVLCASCAAPTRAPRAVSTVVLHDDVIAPEATVASDPPSPPPREPEPWSAQCSATGSLLRVPALTPADPSLSRERVHVYDGPLGSLVAREGSHAADVLWQPAHSPVTASTTVALDPAPAPGDVRWELLSVSAAGAVALRCALECALFHLRPEAPATLLTRLAGEPTLAARGPDRGFVLATERPPSLIAVSADAALVSRHALEAPADGLYLDASQSTWEFGLASRTPAALHVRPTQAPERRVAFSPAPLAACGPGARGVYVTRIDGDVILGPLGSRPLRNARLALAVETALDGGARPCVRSLEARIEELMDDGWLAAGPSLTGTARTVLGVVPVHCRIAGASPRGQTPQQ